MDMAGDSAECRSAIDRHRPTKRKRPQETPFVFVLVDLFDLFGRLGHALARPCRFTHCQGGRERRHLLAMIARATQSMKEFFPFQSSRARPKLEADTLWRGLDSEESVRKYGLDSVYRYMFARGRGASCKILLGTGVSILVASAPVAALRDMQTCAT